MYNIGIEALVPAIIFFGLTVFMGTAMSGTAVDNKADK